jgi:hypothetical protein
MVTLYFVMKIVRSNIIMEFKMKKLLLLLLSTSVNADVVTSTIVHQPPFARQNVTFTLGSTHTYSITNQSATTRDYNVCFRMNICNQYPYYIKTSEKCLIETVKPYENVQGKYDLLFTTQIALTHVQCDVYAQTQVTNAEYNITSDTKGITFL